MHTWDTSAALLQACAARQSWPANDRCCICLRLRRASPPPMLLRQVHNTDTAGTPPRFQQRGRASPTHACPLPPNGPSPPCPAAPSPCPPPPSQPRLQAQEQEHWGQTTARNRAHGQPPCLAAVALMAPACSGWVPAPLPRAAPLTAAKGVRLVAAVAADEPAHVLNNACGRRSVSSRGRAAWALAFERRQGSPGARLQGQHLLGMTDAACSPPHPKQAEAWGLSASGRAPTTPRAPCCPQTASRADDPGWAH